MRNLSSLFSVFLIRFLSWMSWGATRHLAKWGVTSTMQSHLVPHPFLRGPSHGGSLVAIGVRTLTQNNTVACVGTFPNSTGIKRTQLWKEGFRGNGDTIGRTVMSHTLTHLCTHMNIQTLHCQKARGFIEGKRPTTTKKKKKEEKGASQEGTKCQPRVCNPLCSPHPKKFGRCIGKPQQSKRRVSAMSFFRITYPSPVQINFTTLTREI